MRRALLCLAALVSLVACRKDGIREDSFAIFDDKQLPEVSVSVSLDEWNRLLEMFDKDNDTKEYVKCNVEIAMSGRRETVKDAGLRLRGNTSRRRPEGKKGQMHKSPAADWHHFHSGLHFNRFSDITREVDGFRRINLKYAKEDPSYIREHFCFDLLSRYGVWTAPRSSWCKYYLHVGEDPAPAYLGVHLMIESIDRQYLKKRPGFGSADGFLWKCGWGADLRDTGSGKFHLDDNTNHSCPYELKEEEQALFEPAKKQLIGFINNLNNLRGDEFKQWIEKVCDVSLLLKMYAVNVAVGHWDDYWNNMNNYYLYFNSRDDSEYKVFMLPYDYDNTLGTSHYCGVQSDSGRQDPYNWGIKQCPLISRIISIPEYKSIYTAYLKELGSDGNPYFGYDAATARIREWQGLISPYLDNDTGEDTQLRDAPASWGNHPEYRLLQDGANNYFRVKCKVLKGI